MRKLVILVVIASMAVVLGGWKSGCDLVPTEVNCAKDYDCSIYQFCDKLENVCTDGVNYLPDAFQLGFYNYFDAITLPQYGLYIITGEGGHRWVKHHDSLRLFLNTYPEYRADFEALVGRINDVNGVFPSYDCSSFVQNGARVEGLFSDVWVHKYDGVSQSMRDLNASFYQDPPMFSQTEIDRASQIEDTILVRVSSSYSPLDLYFVREPNQGFYLVAVDFGTYLQMCLD